MTLSLFHRSQGLNDDGQKGQERRAGRSRGGLEREDGSEGKVSTYNGRDSKGTQVPGANGERVAVGNIGNPSAVVMPHQWNLSQR